MEHKIDEKPLVCNLTSKELQLRKKEVLVALKAQVNDKKELANGYAYQFANDDNTLDQLMAFIKTERQCCGFFTYNLTVGIEAAWLELTGPEGAKEFITTEMDL